MTLSTPEPLRGPALLRRWRKEHFRSQRDVTDAFGLNKEAVHSWECSKKIPSPWNACRLEHLTGGAVTLEDWGYPSALVDWMAAYVARRGAARAAAARPDTRPVVIVSRNKPFSSEPL